MTELMNRVFMSRKSAGKIATSLIAVLLFAISFGHAAFEPLGYGAVAKGMGGAYTAAAEDESAAYWNPAGLSLLNSPQLASSIEDVFGLGLFRYTTVGYAHPKIGGGTVSVHFLRLQTVGEASFFTYAENTYLVSYGKRVWKPIHAGANIRFYSVASEQRASAISYDLGVLYKPFNDRFRVGLTLQDVNDPRLHWEGGASDVMPASFRLGALAKAGPISEFTLEEDWRRNEKQTYRFGMAHYLVSRSLVLRAGLHRAAGQDEWIPAFGGGLRFRALQADYAWDHDEDSGNTQTFSVSLRFGR